MRDRILETAGRVLQPIILYFSVYLLLVGHDTPGGGFVGGLTATSALVLHALAYGTGSARRALRIPPETLAAFGVSVSAVVALAPMALGAPPLSAAWADVAVAAGPLSLGTPLVFDLGIYLAVLGASLTILFALSEE